MSRVKGSLNATNAGKTDQVSFVLGPYHGVSGVWGKTAFSDIHDLCESFQKQVQGNDQQYNVFQLQGIVGVGAGKKSGLKWCAVKGGAL